MREGCQASGKTFFRSRPHDISISTKSSTTTKSPPSTNSASGQFGIDLSPKNQQNGKQLHRWLSAIQSRLVWSIVDGQHLLRPATRRAIGRLDDVGTKGLSWCPRERMPVS